MRGPGPGVLRATPPLAPEHSAPANRWMRVSAAALARGISAATIWNAVYDGAIRHRRIPRPTRPWLRPTVEVWWPDVMALCLRGKGGSYTGDDSGPVTDETWARFCEVLDQLEERMRGGEA